MIKTVEELAKHIEENGISYGEKPWIGNTMVTTILTSYSGDYYLDDAFDGQIQLYGMTDELKDMDMFVILEDLEALSPKFAEYNKCEMCEGKGEYIAFHTKDPEDMGRRYDCECETKKFQY
jgi:hypothetical protein